MSIKGVEIPTQGARHDEIFAPVVRASTFRTLLAIAGKENLKLHHYNVRPHF